MSKKLEDLFNLPSTDNVPVTDEQLHQIEEDKQSLAEVDEAIDKIDAALPTVRDLEASDKEMDELAKLAQDNFTNLMDLGMSVDSRFSGTIFQTAGTLLGHAITAKQAKLDKKLKMVDLQLKKAAHDFKEQQAALKQLSQASADGETVDGEGVVLDRNDIINAILKKDK
jgi:hypothetical protein